MTKPPNVHHQINYIELAAFNLEKAKQFYSLAFGWKFNAYGSDYLGIRNQDAEGECGGIRPADNITVGGPLVILYSRDLEKSLDAVKEAGGKITAEIFSFPGGRRFQFCDPSGNELAVFSDHP